VCRAARPHRGAVAACAGRSTEHAAEDRGSRVRPARTAGDSRRPRARSDGTGDEAARVSHAARRPGGDAHHAARGRVGPALRPAEQPDRCAHQPPAAGDRPRQRSPADPYRTRLGLRAAQRQLSAVRLDLFNTTAFRLSVGYTLLVTLAVGVTLGSAYFLTESLITDEVDLIIDTELKSLEEKFARSGLAGVTDEINLRIDSWGRIGAVYMLADPNFERIAGNVTDWPFEGMPAERWPEFEIGTIEPGRRAVHPVRAAVRTLPGGDLLLVGTDISQGRRFAEKFRFATLWGIGLSTLAAALAGFWFSYRLARRVGAVASTCERILAGDPGRRLPVAGTRDEFDSLAISVNHVLDRLEEQAG